ncbi:MAG: hypothetical protein V4857_20410 [Pseudomonadota bacterium]
MTVTELFTAIRSLYSEVLVNAIARSHVFAEPALRTADGALALKGEPPLPLRVDMVSKNGDEARHSIMVDSISTLQFAPFAFQMSATEIRICPFAWDGVALSISGLALDAASHVLGTWFMAWFDPDDDNAPTEEGLGGAAHYMSGLSVEMGVIKVGLDLGSAPAHALEDLLFRLADADASQVTLKGED